MNILTPLARSIFVPHKGIIAMDDSSVSANKRLSHCNIATTLKNRTMVREIMVTTPNLCTYVSGIIFHEETLAQKTSFESTFHSILSSEGILTGIKVDKGLTSFRKTEEKVTLGLDTLMSRLKEYKKQGAVFTKWRSVFRISDTTPTTECIQENCATMSSFITHSQEEGFVPIIEPEVLMEGDHSIDTCQQVTEQVLRSLFSKLEKDNTDLESVILKTNMILPGAENKIKCSPEQVAERTRACLSSSLPHDLAGIVFLSGGQSGIEALLNLNAIMKNTEITPWPMTFSFDRIFMMPVLKVWAGKKENIEKAQDKLLHIIKQASRAVEGELML